MGWVITIVVVLAVFAVFEWRARTKPLLHDRADRWGVMGVPNPRPLTGGHDADGRRN
jgi:hypothetical protein